MIFKKFRNLIVHKYDDLDWNAMFDVAEIKMKETEKACQRILEVLDEVIEKDKKNNEKKKLRTEKKKQVSKSK